MPSKKEVKEFSNKIETMVSVYAYSHMEAILAHCKETDMEIELAAKLLTSDLKKKIASEAEGLNLIKPEGGRVNL
jgi:hypothetical protein